MFPTGTTRVPSRGDSLMESDDEEDDNNKRVLTDKNG